MCYSRTPATWRARGGRTRVARAVGTRGLEPERQDQNLQCCRLHHRPSGACCGRSVCTLARGAVRCLEPAVRRELTASSAPGKRSATELLGLKRCVVVTCGGGLWSLPPAWWERSGVRSGARIRTRTARTKTSSAAVTPLPIKVRSVGSTACCRRGNDRARTGDLLLAKDARLPG